MSISQALARCVAAAGVMLLFIGRAAADPAEVVLVSEFQGTFKTTFGTGPDGTNDLYFDGRGRATQLGRTAVQGHSTTRDSPTMPGCMDIVTDEVVLTAANGDELWLVNTGQDCFDF